MSEQAKKPSDNRTATQRLTDLENATMSLFNVSDNVVRDVMTLKEAIKLLDNKVNAIVKATLSGETLTEEVLTRIMVENNVVELSQRVRNMASQGFIVPEEQVSENSFVVGSELDDDGKVVNPRLQFTLKSLSPQLQARILGAKVGETLYIQEGKLQFKVLESYSIQEPKLASAPAPAETSAPAAAEAPEASALEVPAASVESAPEVAPATEAPAAEATASAPEAAAESAPAPDATPEAAPPAAPEASAESAPSDPSAPAASNS